MSDTTPGPGADLQAARESLKVTVREVADALNLPTRVIEALETDDYDRLPPSVFTRGYLRSYARLLELNPDELLARYPEVTEEVEQVSEERTGVHPVAQKSRQLVVPILIGALIVLALLFWLLSGEDASEAGSTGSSAPPAATESPIDTAAESPDVAEPPEPMPAGAATDGVPDRDVLAAAPEAAADAAAEVASAAAAEDACRAEKGKALWLRMVI